MSRPSSRRLVALLALVSALAWVDFFAGTHRASSGRAIVRIEAPDDVGTAYARWTARDGERAVLVVSDGELIATKDRWFPYRDSDGTDLRYTTDGAVARLGSTPVLLNLREASGVEWLDHASDQEVRGLRVVLLTVPSVAGTLPAIERIAQLNPGVGLDLYSADAAPVPGDQAFAVLRRFRPACLLVEDAEIACPALEAVEPGSLETLILGSSICSGAPGRFPRLRRLMLDRLHPDILPPPSLRALSISNDAGDLTGLLESAPHLRELNVQEVGDLRQIAGFTRLESLSLVVRPEDDVSVLKSLPLRRLSLMQPTRVQLEMVVRQHPDLEELVVVTDEIGDPAFLEGLTRPRVLVLIDKTAGLDVSRLAPVGSLRLLVLSRELFEKEPVTAEAVRGRLPDCLVVPGEGACVGSGWLLVFTSAVALLGAALARRRRSPAAP